MNDNRIDKTIEYKILGDMFNIPEGKEIIKIIINSHEINGVDFTLLLDDSEKY